MDRKDYYTSKGEVVDVDEKDSIPYETERQPGGHMTKDETIAKVLEVHEGGNYHHHKLGHHDRDVDRVRNIVDLIEDGERKYHKLSWWRLYIVMLVSAVALGTLSMPSVFATLGIIGGTITSVSMGCLSVYTSYVVGQVKIRYPQVHHWSDVGRVLIPGKGGVFLSRFMACAYVFFVCLAIGSHYLTGKAAFRTIVDDPAICGVVWSVVTLVVMFVFSLPPSFNEISWLGYVDFASIMSAVFCTLISTGISARKKDWHTGWMATAQPGTTFERGLVSASNAIFAYAFNVGQFSFMEEMANIEDYPKSIYALGITMICIHTTVGALGYVFVGPGIKSPALLSAGHTMARIAFGLALPVIFISGAVLCVMNGRFIMDKMYPNSVVRYVNTARGWAIWITIIAVLSLFSWLVSEVIPGFNALLGLVGALFNTATTVYGPSVMWFVLVRKGPCFGTRRNTILTLVNGFIIAIGLFVLVAGTYASIKDIVDYYNQVDVGKPFSCKA